MKCYNNDCAFNNNSSVNNCMIPNFTKECKDFKPKQDNPPSGINIHQPESEFKTITIEMHTKESARDFFVIIEKVVVNLLTKEQAKILTKIRDFTASGI